MALNLGTQPMEAARSLATDRGEDVRVLFEQVRAGIHEEVRKKMNAALDAGPDDRHMAVGYARALRDVYMALESAVVNGAAPVRSEAPAPVGGKNATR